MSTLTPSDRKALHTLLDGLINAGATIRLDGYLFPNKTSPSQVATAVAAFDEWSIETLTDVDKPSDLTLSGGFSPEVHVIHYGCDREPDMTPYEYLGYVRSLPAYAPAEAPAPPVRSSVGVHRRYGEDAGIV